MIINVPLALSSLPIKLAKAERRGKQDETRAKAISVHIRM